MSSQFGRIFKISTFGESHGKAIGVVIDGCPAGIHIDMSIIQKKLDRRKPGQSSLTSPRKEPDELICLSGIEDHQTLGSPITLITYNKDAKPQEYKDINQVMRPSHSDFTSQEKYGIRSKSGGGRLSARETWSRVAAAGVAEQVLKALSPNLKVSAFISAIGGIQAKFDLTNIDTTNIPQIPLACPDVEAAIKMEKYIEQVRDQGDSCGGVITGLIENCPVGLGEPVFDKFEALLAHGMLSLPASKSFEIGSGLFGTTQKGSEHNDPFYIDPQTKKVRTRKNSSGGIQGGISNGEQIHFRVGFKPTSTIFKSQESIDSNQKEVTFSKKDGRHDPCVLPRAVVIVEAMAELVALDLLLLHKTQNKQ